MTHRLNCVCRASGTSAKATIICLAHYYDYNIDRHNSADNSCFKRNITLFGFGSRSTRTLSHDLALYDDFKLWVSLTFSPCDHLLIFDVYHAWLLLWLRLWFWICLHLWFPVRSWICSSCSSTRSSGLSGAISRGLIYPLANSCIHSDVKLSSTSSIFNLRKGD